jgi:hypothetical protein
MPDGFIRIRAGEKRPIYGQATAQTGTLTIQASPAPSCTLYDSTGAPVTGLNNVAASGYDAVALANPRVWYNLDTTSPANLAAGYYTMVFKFTAAGSDSLNRVYEPSIEIQVSDVRV